MKEQILLKALRLIIKYIGLLIPVAIGVASYYYLKVPLVIVLSFYFLLLSRSQFELYEKMNELDEKKAEESQAWKSLLNKRKSF